MHHCLANRLALPLLAFAFLLIGCDSGGSGESPADPTGVWREVVDENEFTSYAVIEEGTVDFYTEGRYRGTCWVIAEWTIVERDASEYVMENDSGTQSTFTIVRESDRLTIERFEYVEADRTASEVEAIYPLCPQEQN